MDDSKLIFSSSWDIDQLVDTGTAAVGGAGETTIYTFTGDAPVFEVQFKPSGDTRWYSAGMNSTSDTTAGLFYFTPYISGSTIKIHTESAGTARYFIWADKVIQ